MSFLPSIELKKDKVNIERLKQSLYGLISSKQDKFSIYFRDLKTDDAFGINSHKILTGASLNKLFIVSYMYKLASEKNIDLEEKVMVQENDIQDYGTGVLRYQDPGQALSLRSLAELSLRKSDNTAAHILSIRLGEDNIQKFIDSIGLLATDMNENKTTAEDMGKMFSLLYSNKIVSPALKDELFDYLTNTDFEDRLARDIPKEIRIFHKSGDAVSMIHDVGIIDNGNHAFILAVLSNDVKDEEETKKTIGEIAKKTLELYGNVKNEK